MRSSLRQRPEAIVTLERQDLALLLGELCAGPAWPGANRHVTALGRRADEWRSLRATG